MVNNLYLLWYLEKMCKYEHVPKMKAFKRMASQWNQLKKDFIQFLLFCRSGESLSGIHRIEAQEETNCKMNSLISEAAPQTWFYKKVLWKYVTMVGLL